MALILVGLGCFVLGTVVTTFVLGILFYRYFYGPTAVMLVAFYDKYPHEFEGEDIGMIERIRPIAERFEASAAKESGK